MNMKESFCSFGEGIVLEFSPVHLEMIQLHSSAVQLNVSRLASLKSIKKTAVIFFSHMFEDII